MPLRCQASAMLSSSLYCIRFGLVWAGIYTHTLLGLNPPTTATVCLLPPLRLTSRLMHARFSSLPLSSRTLGSTLTATCRSGQEEWAGGGGLHS